MPIKPRVNITHALAIDGWTSELELQWLAQQAHEISQEENVIIVEIGTYLGRSARAIADSMRPVDTLKLSLYCIDPYTSYVDPVIDFANGYGSTIYEHACQNLKAYMDFGLVCMLREASIAAVSRFEPQSVDMVFIDGDHSYASVAADIAAWVPIVKPGGLLCGHDYGVHPGVAAAVDERFSRDMLEFPVGSIWAVRL